MSQGIFGGGNGSAATPYVVEDAADLSAMRFYPSACYVLANSVNLGVYPYNVGKGWLPIKNFTGSIDGNGKRIMNLYINRPLANNVGFLETFSCVAGSTATVHDVCFDNASVVGQSNVGILAGTFDVAQNVAAQDAFFVDGCRFTGSVSGKSNVGGVFGQQVWSGTFTWTPAFMSNVEVSATVTPTDAGSGYAALVGLCAFTRAQATFTNIVSTSSFSNVVNGVVNQTLNPSALVNYAAGSKSALAVNVLYDNTLWPYGTSVYGVSSNALTLRTSSTLDGVYDPVSGKSIWSIVEGKRAPRLVEFLQRGYLVRSTDGYLAYDRQTGVWKTVLTRTPTRNEAVALAMTAVDDLPATAWAALRAKYATVDLIGVVECSGGTTYATASAPMTVDAANSSTDRNVFRKTINFADCGDAVVSITKEVIR